MMLIMTIISMLMMLIMTICNKHVNDVYYDYM